MVPIGVGTYLGRVLAATLGFCLLLLGAAMAPAGVAVTRQMPVCAVAANAMIEVNLDVTLTGAPPNGLVIEEQLPPGWGVAQAAWAGARAAADPVFVNGRYKWLFDPLNLPVAEGRLTITVRFPAETATGSYAFAGQAKWLEGGSEAAVPTDGTNAVSLTTMAQGWNLMALARDVAGRRGLDLLFSAMPGQPLLAGDVKYWDSANGLHVVLGDDVLPAAQGFWGYVPASGPITVVVGHGPASDVVLRPGWNLIGVTQDTPAAFLLSQTELVGEIWWWDPVLGVYRAVLLTDVLVPGHGYWVFLDGSAPVAIPYPVRR